MMMKILLGSVVSFLLAAGGLAASPAPEPQRGPDGAGADRPNVLFISIDDMRTQLGAYGHAGMITPNLDRLAAGGRLFSRHYAQVPTCGPSRACMLTGKNLRARGDINHHHLAQTLAGTDEPVSPETLVHHFKQNGYRTVGMGKISHSGGGGFRDKTTGRSGRELPHSWDDFVKLPDSRWGPQDPVHAFAYGKNRKDEAMPPFECLDLEDEDYPDGRLAAVAVDQLAELADGDEPFYMAVGFFKPHLPFCAPKKYWDLYDRADVPLSPNPDLPDAVDEVFLHHSSEFFGQYKGGRETGGAGLRLSDDYARELRHGYFAAVTYVDAQVGKVLDQLEALGLAENTVVVVWGDHGWHLGDHTIWGKHSSFERALNSMLLVKAPGMPQPGVPTRGLVASIDLYPTLCELADLPRPEGLEGESFAGLLHDPAAEGKPAVLSFWRDILSVRTDRYRMALFRDGHEQKVVLFDHDVDPDETRNVAEESPDEVGRMTTLLRQQNRGFLPGFDE